MAFKLEDKMKYLDCYINGLLMYRFIRNKNNNGRWEAFKMQDGEITGKPVDCDQYRYDLAERLDLQNRSN